MPKNGMPQNGMPQNHMPKKADIRILTYKEQCLLKKTKRKKYKKKREERKAFAVFCAHAGAKALFHKKVHKIVVRRGV